MKKYELIKYNSDAEGYGIDESFTKTRVDMLVDSLYELIRSKIDEIGEFKTILSKRNMVSFTASKQLTRSVA